MRRQENYPLSELTTLGLGGPAVELIEVDGPGDLIDAVADADDEGRPVLIVAGGSNLVIADEGWPGLAVVIRSGGVEIDEEAEAVRLTASSGEDWDGFVARCVEVGLAGVECLSGIPGSVGATPIQNVGAYGQEVAETIIRVAAFDRVKGEVIDLGPEQCGFGYRSSAFKGSERYLVLAVEFELERSELSRPIAYAQLAGALGVGEGERAPLGEVREAVLALRRSKGMVVDPADPDSRSAGSFFTNPILTTLEHAALAGRVAELLGSDIAAPNWPAPGGGVKTSAAWLIERAGFGPGYGDGAAGISGKHSLALINRGEATTADLLDLAREIRAGVEERFGVTLVPEPTLVGVTL